MNKYTAIFSTGEAIERKFAKPLTHAWRAVVSVNGAELVKTGMAQSKAGAEKALAFPKRYTVVSTEIVETKDEGEVERKAKKQPAKKAKPAFVKGDAVTITLGGLAIVGTLAKLGTKYAYITVTGALTEIKVNASDVKAVASEPEPVENLAIAA